MQWGDTSFVQMKVSDFIGNGKGFEKSIKQKILNRKHKKFASLLTYHVKINYLTNLYKRQKSEQSLRLMLQQMRSMQKMDNLFGIIK